MSWRKGGLELSRGEKSKWIFEEVMWTAEENKEFEKALAFHDDKDNPESWIKIAALIPGKTVTDVIKRYKELEDDVSDIEAGLIPVPGYGNGGHTIDCYRAASSMMPEKERKKGIPWTQDEHRLFLMGLNKYGKGDWRNIARNFVTTRTPTQVASHAQKYFIRQLTDSKDKRRSSIHDITTIHLPPNQPINSVTPPTTSFDYFGFSSPSSTHYDDVSFPQLTT